jgi:predicted component of viral defense system (DUF524 family)
VELFSLPFKPDFLHGFPKKMFDNKDKKYELTQKVRAAG